MIRAVRWCAGGMVAGCWWESRRGALQRVRTGLPSTRESQSSLPGSTALQVLRDVRLCQWLNEDQYIGLPTAADEIPGDFFESLQIPGVFRFFLNKRPSKNL